MELVIYKPTDDQFLTNIEFNFEELKTQITNAVQPYLGMTFTDTEIKMAKEDIATLRRFRGALEDKRKNVKAQCLAPYTAFEAQIKELTSLIDEPVNEIDAQIKDFEKRRKADKLAELEAYFEEAALAAEMDSLLTWPKVMDERWANVSYALRTAKVEIDAAIENAIQAVAKIKAMKSDYEFEMIEAYKESLDINKALAKDAELRSIAQLKAEMKARKQEAAQYAGTVTAGQGSPPPASIVERADAPKTASSEERMYTVAFRVTGTQAELLALSEYMTAANLKVERA